MADALISIALKKLADVVEGQLSLFASATRELQKLSSTFQSIRAVLDDAESRQASDESVQLWLSRLRHVAYDIEDLVEDGQISGLGDEEGNEDDRNSRNKLRLCIPFCRNGSDYVVSRHRMAHSIKEISDRLDQIVDDKNNYGFSSVTPGGGDRKSVGSQRLTTSLMDESEMSIGRENDKETIVGKLVSGSSHEDRGRVQVVAVVGIGGLGKTTLARQIYHDRRVREHFDKALYWVCVSETFDVIKLIKDIIEEVPSASTTSSTLNALQKELLEALRGKRFLLVLDDVWNDNADKWKSLRLPLDSGAQGSRILVTTRGEKVAKTMKATYIHELQGLSDDDSWEVFRSRAFVERKPEECSMLENVGRQIASKCGGVPLAITVMGSAMDSKGTIADWQNILDSKMWSLRDAKNGILPALWLSYCNLPPQLKQCFAYCSMFPKDWELEKDMLVRLWTAQGFIRSDGIRDIEDIGAGYFDDLVAWSMFQEVKENSEGKITCKMHDLLHDLAESIGKDEIYTFIDKSEKCPSNVRHSFFSFNSMADCNFSKIQIALGNKTKLRTFFLVRLRGYGKFNFGIFHKKSFVRALVLRHCGVIKGLPKAIGDLKHLRYLDLSRSDIVELPESVIHLPNLHTLNLTDCGVLKKLPRGIGGMVSLRHLEIEGTDRLGYLPKGLGRISGLRSLSKFIVGGRDEGEGCGIDELQALDSLRGNLRIEHLERVSSREEAEKAELWKKQYLCSLVLEMPYGRNGDAETGTIDSVLEGLRPHENLKELDITGFTGSKLPGWMDGMLCLQKLRLYSGPKLERVPHLPSLKEFAIQNVSNEILPDEGWEQLVALQELSIQRCRELKCLSEGLTQLPSLENLEISECDNFESLPVSFGQLRKLKSLHVGRSKVLACLPDSLGQLKSLETLYISSCEKLESLPDSLGQLKSLERLFISSCEKLESLPDSLGQLKKLKRLDVVSSEVLTCLPDSVGQLKALQSLRIGWLYLLTCLPDSLGQLESLESLDIFCCGKLESLPDSVGQLESLESLYISSCKNLEALPVSLGQLKKLKSLQVRGSELLTCLPDSVGRLESLERLEILECKKLESLPVSLGQLKKLKSLTVAHSQVLTCLPDSVGQLESLKSLHVASCNKLESLPQGLRHLSRLHTLNIARCPLLRERCKREGGVDWPNISHIPDICIDLRIQ